MVGKQEKNGESGCRGSFEILNDQGLHTRPAAEIVKCAASFKSEIWLSYQNQEVNAKSVLGIMMLAAARGAKISVRATGEDAQQAVDALIALAKSRFGMKY